MSTPSPLFPSLLDDTVLLDELIRRVSDLEAGKTCTLTGMAGSMTAIVLAALSRRTVRQLLILAPDKETALRLSDDLGLLAGSERVRVFLGREEKEAVLTERSREVNDVHTLRSLTTEQTALVVTHPQGALLRVPSPAAVRANAYTLAAGGDAEYGTLIDVLGRFRFDRVDLVQKPGEYAVRGGIIDVFPFVGENPLRIELFGETIESVREFDVTSQRSIRTLSSALLVPDLMAGDGEEPAGSGMLLDYVADGALLVMLEPLLVEEGFRRLTAAETHRERLHTADRFRDVASLFPAMHLVTLSERSADVDAGARPQPSFNSSTQVMCREIAERQAEGYRILLTCDSQSELNRLKELLGTAAAAPADGPAPDLAVITFSLEALHEGFVIPSLQLAVFTEHQAFGRIKRHGKRRRPRFKGMSESEIQQLRKGDYVVHEDFGIGKFAGLRTIRVRDVAMEVAAVTYAENDTLYVNISYINKLQKYSSKDGHVPALHRLGSGEWERLKARTKKRVKDIARDLIALYSRRKHMEGFPFPDDGPWQAELEASFMYEDTFDQAKATVDVKRDMEASSPMDRLICGDVGFGKTEVAVRAAFKAVVAGKQVAVLVPTTILTMQHLNTFRDRVQRYGVSVEALSRFTSKKDQVQVLARLREGLVDVIIGTHRLLSKDVGFKDLGLLVVDEEHRFGVAAKEKLRQMRTQVDTLALTATPIPRTLHFSLMGARDLSIIATPPRNRLPILTEITQWNDDLLREVVRRELQRGGQVYFVHDRVQTIDAITERLQGLLPGVRILSAHGQMQSRELEEAMMAFLERRVDVLVSTKIIESGLDIPNVNTIIIHRADRFGMAELYQLRGRVGRSNAQAYAYLLTPPVSVLTRPTLQRLQALQEFTELGSGFNLSMRDLEIRGAGNLLGSEQSGFIEAMGFETYTRILEEAVQELKEEEFADLLPAGVARPGAPSQVVVEAELEAFLPETYVGSEAERLTIYRRLHALNTNEQLEEIGLELRDRFGRPPVQVDTLFGVIRLKLAAGRLGFPKLHLTGERLEVSFPPHADGAFYGSDKFQRLMTVISHMRGRGVRVVQSDTLLKTVVPLASAGDDGSAVDQSLAFLHELSSSVDNASQVGNPAG